MSYTGYITRTYLQLDEPRQDALDAHTAGLLKQQRDEEAVVLYGALTIDQIHSMTLGDLQRHASQVGVPMSAVIRVAEASV
jgi:hypothetical protein